MFAKLFAFFFGKKKDPEPTLTWTQRMEQEDSRRQSQTRYIQPLRTSKARSASSASYSSPARRDDDIMSNPIHPVNPLNPIGFNSSIYHDSTPSHTSHSSSNYDCGSSSSSSSSYDSGSSSSCDSGSSSSSYGD